MKKLTNFSPHLRTSGFKRWLGLLTCFTVFWTGMTSYAQTNTSTVGSGTGFNSSTEFPCPFGNYYWGTKNQFLVTAGELASAGMGADAEISSVGFNVINVNQVPMLENYVVKIYAVSSLDPLAADWYVGTPVAQATIGSFTPVSGWNQLEFDTPYEWNGTSHLVIETCSQNSAWTNDGNASVEWTSNLGGATWTRWYRADSDFQCSSTFTTDTSTTTRPNMRFEWDGDLPTCATPTDLTVGGLTFNSADLSWTSTGTLFDIEYGEAGFTPTGTPSTGLSGLTTTSHTLSGLTAETNYHYYVRQDCGSGNTSLWAGPYAFFTGYCIPTSTYDDISNRIFGFSTTDGYTNIFNENNGTDNAYNNYSNMAVTQSVGGTFYYNISVPSYTYVEVWVDLDQNLIFDETLELVASFEFAESNTTFTGAMMIPTGTPLGDYRMRIRSRAEWNTTASPCGEISYSEAEDYTISVVDVPTCLPPSGLAVDGLTFTSVDVSWTSTGTLFDIEYGEAGFTPTGTPSTGYAGITNNFITITGLTSETHYQYYVRQDCGSGDTSLWAGPFPFFTGYCIPTSTYTGEWNRITGFSTTEGYTNISNENNGIANAYNNYSNMAVSQAPGGTFNYSINVPSYTNVEVWVDLDQNLIFDETLELVASFEYAESNTTFTGSMLIPPGTPLGDYRMRIRSRDYWNTTASPCGEISYTETEDYTITVVDMPTCLPPTGLTINGITFTSADVAWTSTGTLFDVEYGEAGFTPTGTPSTGYTGITNSFVTITGLTSETHYQYYVRQDCGSGDTSLWAGPFPFFTGYCIPTSTYTGEWNRIIGFSTTDGYTNISNEDNGTANAYSNYSNLSVTQSPEGAFNYHITVPSYTNVEVWIDLDQNLIFDETMELLASFEYEETETTFTGTMLIPIGTPLGDYRMRIRSRDYWNTAASPCGEISYTETEDYTVSIVPLPTCLPPSGLTVTGLDFTTADVAWTSTGTLFDIEFGITGFTPTGTPSTGYSGITGTSHTITDLTPETHYQYYVRQDCGSGDTSLWSGPHSFFTGYCIPTSTYTGEWNRISGFSTTNGFTNISNLNNGTANAYSNFSNMVVTQSAEGEFTYNINVPSYTNVEVWVDLDQNLIFDETLELIAEFQYAEFDTTFTGTMLIPAGTAEGDYRMRIRSRDYWNTIATPCGQVSYTETEDYTITVVAPPACLPPSGLTATPLSLSSAEFTWVSAGSNFDLEWGEQGFTQGTGTMATELATTTYQIDDLTMGTTYEFYVRQDCGAADGESIWSGPLSVYIGYCTPVFANDCSSGDTINNFVMIDAGINHIGSGCSANNYGDFTNDPTLAGTMETGETYDFEITHEYNYDQHVKIWIDYNSNGVFETTELLFTSATYIENGITTGSITISDTAPTGTFRMRAVNQYGGAATDACTGANYGETHDYTVTITSTDPCDGVTAPTGATEQSLLLGQNIAGLNVAGNNLVWYSDEDLTVEIPNTTVAVDGTTYYVVSETDTCQSDALAITVTVIDPCAQITTPTGDANQTLEEGDTLADLVVNGDNLAWYADADLTISIPATTVAQNGVTYYVASVTDICQSEGLAITVTITGVDPCEGVTVPAPTGEENQTFNEGQTLADLIVEGENLAWYADEDLTQPLEETHVVENGVTYYVTQATEDGCTSEALAVTVTTLGTTDFETFVFRFYPNPVGEVLNLTSNSEITQIDLFNMLGQKVNAFTNANNTQVDMSGLPTGNYIISVTIEGITKTFKVVKN